MYAVSFKDKILLKDEHLGTLDVGEKLVFGNNAATRTAGVSLETFKTFVKARHGKFEKVPKKKGREEYIYTDLSGTSLNPEKGFFVRGTAWLAGLFTPVSQEIKLHKNDPTNIRVGDTLIIKSRDKDTRIEIQLVIRSL